MLADDLEDGATGYLIERALDETRSQQFILITRNGFDWTARYPAIAADLKALACQSCIIDGEVVILDDNGAIPIFDRLRHGPRVKTEALLYAFDLLGLDEEDPSNPAHGTA